MEEIMRGIKISLDNNELVIKGNKDDLIELSSYISNIANSNLDNDHLHLDELAIIDKESNIKNVIIEKEV
jgi:hypothetical protein